MQQYWDDKTRTWRTRKPTAGNYGQTPDVSSITGRVDSDRDTTSALLDKASDRASALLDDDTYGIDQKAEELAFSRAEEELRDVADESRRGATYRSIARGNYRGGGINRAEDEIAENVNDQLRKFKTDLTIDQARRRTQNQQNAISQAANIGSTQANLGLANRSQALAEDQVYDVDGNKTVSGANAKTSRDAQIGSLVGELYGKKTLAGRAQQASEDQIYDVEGTETVSGANAAAGRDAQLATLLGEINGKRTLQGQQFDAEYGEDGFRERELQINELNAAMNRAIAQGNATGEFVDPETGKTRDTLQKELAVADLLGEYGDKATLKGQQFDAEYGEDGLKERQMNVTELNAAMNRAIAQGNATGEFVDPETGMSQDTLQKELAVANMSGYMPDGTTPTLAREEFELVDKKFDLMIQDRNMQNITDFTQTMLTVMGLGNELTFAQDLQNWLRTSLGVGPGQGQPPNDGIPGQSGDGGGNGSDGGIGGNGGNGGNGDGSGDGSGLSGNPLTDDPDYEPLRTYLNQSGFSTDGLELVNSDGLVQTFKTQSGETIQVRWTEDGSRIDAVLDENGNLKGKMFGDRMVTGDNLWRGIKGQTALRVLADLYFNGPSPDTLGRLPKHLQSSIISSMSNLAIGNPYLALAASIGADQVIDRLGNVPEAEAFKTAASDGDLSDVSTEQLISWRDGFVMGMNPSGQNAWSVGGETRWNSQSLMPYSAPLDYEITVRGFQAMEEGGFDIEGAGQSLATELSKRAGVSEADAWQAISRGYLKHGSDMNAMVDEFQDMGLMSKDTAAQFLQSNSSDQNVTDRGYPFTQGDYDDFRQAFSDSKDGKAYDGKFDLDRDGDVDFTDFTSFAAQIGGVNAVEGPGTSTFGSDAPHGPTEIVGKIGNRTIYVDELDGLSIDELRQLKSGAPSNWQSNIDTLITQKTNDQPGTKPTVQSNVNEITGQSQNQTPSQIVESLGSVQMSQRAKNWLNSTEGLRFVTAKLQERGPDRAKAEVERFLKTL